MVVDELFKKLEKKTERDLLNQASRSAFMAQTQAVSKITNSKLQLKNIKIATEVLWFFAALAIGFLMGYLFYELFSIWLPETKNDLIKMLFITKSNFIYFLSAISIVGVYITRLIIWALKLLQ
jgi:hypothetical protein